MHCRVNNKTVLLAENKIVRFPTEETNKGQDDMITWGETNVEALRKRLSVKKNFRMERLCMWPFANYELVDVTNLITEQLNWSHTHFVCAWIGHIQSVSVRNIKEAIITVITNYLPKVNYDWLAIQLTFDNFFRFSI